MGRADHRAHFVLVPFMAQGHIIPMVDLAGLLAHRGMLVSLITTPFNASRLQPTIDRARDSDLPIRFVPLRFPCEENGLPSGCENVDVLPSDSNDLVRSFFFTLPQLEEPLRQYLKDRPPLPTCIVSDFCHPWTRKVCDDLKMPRYVFYSVCCFTLYCHRALPDYYEEANVTDMNEPLVIPGLPHRVEVTRAQASGFFPRSSDHEGFERVRLAVEEAEATADGIVVNTFEEMEPEYIKMYAAVMGRKVWPVGPISHFNKDIAGQAARGKKSSIDVEMVSRWLDTMEAGSVVYMCLGSITRTPLEQVKEIGLGLEATGRPFLLVIKSAEKMPEIEAWFAEEGFEERTRERSMIIRGWAPQVPILSHPSVGGFVTHCGWNSTMESISAGVPMVTWPCFADQFLNERFVVDVARVGVPVGVKVPSNTWSYEVAQLITSEEVAGAVKQLMDEGEEGEERRKRAWELREKAARAIEMGGASDMNVSRLIGEALQLAGERMEY